MHQHVHCWVWSLRTFARPNVRTPFWCKVKAQRSHTPQALEIFAPRFFGAWVFSVILWFFLFNVQVPTSVLCSGATDQAEGHGCVSCCCGWVHEAWGPRKHGGIDALLEPFARAAWSGDRLRVLHSSLKQLELVIHRQLVQQFWNTATPTK